MNTYRIKLENQLLHIKTTLFTVYDQANK